MLQSIIICFHTHTGGISSECHAKSIQYSKINSIAIDSIQNLTTKA